MDSTTTPTWHLNAEVYSNPGCGPCMATKRHFAKRGIKIDALWASDHPEVVDLAKRFGLDVIAPIVVIRDTDGDVIDIWTNYRRDAIDLWAESPDLPRTD